MVPKGADAVPLVDLRPLGAPLAPYAVKVHRLTVNGRAVQLSKPCVAVIDTGTTGLSISDTLYDSDELPMPGAAMRDVELQFLTERGAVVSLAASSRRRPDDDFPLVVTPVAVPWFQPENVRKARNGPGGIGGIDASGSSSGSGGRVGGGSLSSTRAGSSASSVSVSVGGSSRSRSSSSSSSRENRGGSDGGPGLGDAPHVLFVGLAFLAPRTLTIDIDACRMAVGDEPRSSSSIGQALVHEGWEWKRAARKWKDGGRDIHK
jgi:hypothetical protein